MREDGVTGSLFDTYRANSVHDAGWMPVQVMCNKCDWLKPVHGHALKGGVRSC